MRSINKQTKNNGFIFSVFQGNKDLNTNKTNHDNTIKHLITNNVTFKLVEGAYTHLNGEKVSEPSFYVETNTSFNKDKLEQFVFEQCNIFNQESYLVLEQNRDANLKLLNGDAHQLGIFTQVSELEALNSEAYTYCPVLETYFVTK